MQKSIFLFTTVKTMASLYLVLAPEDFDYIAVFRNEDDAEEFLIEKANDQCSWCVVLEPGAYTLTPNVTSQCEEVWVSYYHFIPIAERCPGCGWKPIIAASKEEISEIRKMEACEEYGCYDFRSMLPVTIDSRILQPPADNEEEPDSDYSASEDSDSGCNISDVESDYSDSDYSPSDYSDSDNDEGYVTWLIM